MTAPYCAHDWRVRLFAPIEVHYDGMHRTRERGIWYCSKCRHVESFEHEHF